MRSNGGAEQGGSRLRRQASGIPLRAVLPNAVTALALCSGLTAIRYAIGQEWERAVIFIMAAGVLDGIDGRIARMLRGESRFGAELDSLADAIDFGVTPAIVVYLWSLQISPRFGWLCALLYAVFCALRLARFNARIDVTEQPHKSAGFLTGVPAPAGAGLALMPLYLSFITDEPVFRSPLLAGPWLVFIALLMVSNIATYSWTSLKLRRTVRFDAIVVVVLVAAALISAPWQALTVICALYLVSIPFSIRTYAKIRRLRAEGMGAPRAGP